MKQPQHNQPSLPSDGRRDTQMRSVRSMHDLDLVRNQRTRSASMLHGAAHNGTSNGYLARSGSIPEKLSIMHDGPLMYDGGPYRDGRSRGRSSTRRADARRTWRTTDEKVLDTGSPRSDGLHMRARPRPALRRPNAFFLSSRKTHMDDMYTGAWRTHNTKSAMFGAGNRGLASDAGLQRQLHRKLARHTRVARRNWNNGGSLF
mgnify:CR=1 FL=1|jgi:hypothetical protein